MLFALLPLRRLHLLFLSRLHLSLLLSFLLLFRLLNLVLLIVNAVVDEGVKRDDRFDEA